MIAPIVIRYVQSVSNRRHHVGAFEARSVKDLPLFSTERTFR